MKKPKTRLNTRAKEKPPTDSLIVDYGLRRVVLPYRYRTDMYNNKDLDLICNWCANTFPVGEWYSARNSWPGYMYFLEESYVTLFVMQWAK